MQLANENYRVLGLLAFIVLVFGLTTIVVKWYVDKEVSFSKHIARKKGTIIYYTLLFSIVLPLLLLFFFNWFIPVYNLPFLFGMFIVLSSITQYSCTLIPDTGGKKTTYHGLLAGLSALFLIPTLIILLLSEQVVGLDKVLVSISLLIMLAIVFLIGYNRGKHSHFLILQSVYFLSFFIPILAITYL